MKIARQIGKELYSFTSSTKSIICTSVAQRVSSISFINGRNKAGRF